MYLTFTRIDGENEEVPSVSEVDSITEHFATWSSISERGPRMQASIPPFMGNFKSQMHDPLSSQLSHSSKLESDMETKIDLSIHTQPRPSILSSQLPEQHTNYRQEAKSDTMDKTWYRPLETLKGHHTGSTLWPSPRTANFWPLHHSIKPSDSGPCAQERHYGRSMDIKGESTLCHSCRTAKPWPLRHSMN